MNEEFISKLLELTDDDNIETLETEDFILTKVSIHEDDLSDDFKEALAKFMLVNIPTDTTVH